MGLLDGMLGNVLSSVMGSGSNDPKVALIQGVLSMMLNNNQANNQVDSGGTAGMIGNVLSSVMGASQSGGLTSGLGGLLSTMAQNGMGNQAASWQGTGANLPINADQLTQILGSLGGGTGADILGKLAGSAGLKPSEAAGYLSELLPNLVDKLTPDGQIPDNSNLDLGSIMRSMLGK
ncbi:MAG: hypothetical protein RI956_426 [Pseudomonadota bacterium]|jgi:uncharacterized protein YidB (DUF937 family)